MANVENPRQVQLMLRSGLDGIGLFRTEFMALGPSDIPAEEEQYAMYRKVFRAAEGRPVAVRTFDIAADKRNPMTGGHD